MDNPCSIPMLFYAGETYAPPPFLWQNVVGFPIDVTGYTGTFTIRQTPYADDPAIYIGTSQNGQIVFGGTAGTMQLILTPTITAALPNPFQGYYDIWAYAPTGQATRLFGGPIYINEPVTRP